MEYNDRPAILTTRVVDAPIDKVFDAWTYPVYLSQWWGPKGFTNSFLQYDLHPGGIWDFIMHAPDGNDYPNKCEFITIEPPYHIAWYHLTPPPFDVDVQLEKVGEKTRVLFRMLFDRVEDRDKKAAFVLPLNEENMDKLEALLKTI